MVLSLIVRLVLMPAQVHAHGLLVLMLEAVG